jgi:hypothetical protein
MAKDISDLLAEQGRDAVRASLRDNLEAVNLEGDIPRIHIPKAIIAPQADTKKWKLPPMEDAFAFLEKPLFTPPELVHGLLHKGDKMVLSGGSKSYKTWMLMHMAICVATGKTWLGLPTTPGKVLYANFEVRDSFFQRRMKMLLRKLDLDPATLMKTMTVWNLKGCGADITDLAKEITERTSGKFDLIIFDPIYKMLGVICPPETGPRGERGFRKKTLR